MYREYIFERVAPMKRTVSVGQAVVWPLLLPGNLVCSALGLGKQNDLVRMLVNSLVWTALGVLVVIFAT
jgi:hypothetical protein